jgi:hypothetical protein
MQSSGMTNDTFATSRLLILIILLFAVVCARSSAFATPAISTECPKGISKKWCKKFEAKQQQLAQHFVNNPSDAAEYYSGSNGQGVYSIFLFKLFPELLPDVWGSSQGFEILGFAPNPLDPSSALPLGLSSALSLDEIASLDGQKKKMTLVGTTCASCHTGQVRIGDGSLQTIWGAPSNRIQNPLVLFAKSAIHPNLNADAFRELAQKRTADYFFGKQVTVEQVAEFEFFKSPGVAEALVARIKASGSALHGAMKNVISPIVYAPHGSAASGIFDVRPGSMDALFGT